MGEQCIPVAPDHCIPGGYRSYSAVVADFSTDASSLRKAACVNTAAKRLRLLVRLARVAFILFFLGFVIFFSMDLKDIGLLSPRGNPWLRLIQVFGWLAVLGTFIALYNAVRSWQDGATLALEQDWRHVDRAFLCRGCMLHLYMALVALELEILTVKSGT